MPFQVCERRIRRMGMEREVGAGITERQARHVFKSVRGLKGCAAKLGVGKDTAARWARELGVEILPYLRGGPRLDLRRFSDEDILAAVLSPHSLSQAAHLIGMSGPGLLKRARSMGLPTDRSSRVAFRAAGGRRAAA